ncbi:PadR family transcriptional regulator [Inconstantimicrobium mannanitabidum]|uniref:PadR family transcriptional regulator n=1 Tax=Inconstantimicrobium mannanitabidum TaxID=1604901 RepID=A0ACB5RHM1_9CLOT|nr:PadR family transcriptional regulator [Clostridium sp. TW13]GKX68582.1 PadR family transcriptional regulator [Clostridium sp. TW13]
MYTEILKGNIDTIMLALISNEDMYGYDIAKLIKQKTDNSYQIGEGTLYPALKRLEDKNYLQSYWGSSDGGVKRKYYSITETGKNELLIRIDSWRKINNLINSCVGGGI